MGLRYHIFKLQFHAGRKRFFNPQIEQEIISFQLFIHSKWMNELINEFSEFQNHAFFSFYPVSGWRRSSVNSNSNKQMSYQACSTYNPWNHHQDGGKDVRLGKKTQTRKSLVPLPEWEINLAKVTCHTRFYNNFVFFRARALRVNYCCHVTWTPCISFIKQNNKNTYKSLTKTLSIIQHKEWYRHIMFGSIVSN